MSRAVRLLVAIRDSFWFFAMLCTIAAIIGVEALAWVDRADLVGDTLFGGFLLEVGAEGSRGLLSAIATSMLGAAATTFSITVAVLALTSSSYGPRLVRNFLTDRGNQFVLGYLVGTAVFALLVLRHVRVLDLDSDDSAFVPHLATNVAVVLAIIGVGVLVYFIHHISVAIQVSSLSTRVREALKEVVDRMYPEGADAGHRPLSEPLVSPDAAHAVVRAHGNGYVRGIDSEEILEAAVEADAFVEVVVRPGTHMIEGEPCAYVRFRDEPAQDVRDQLVGRVRDAVALGGSRTPYQDVEFVVSQHVDLAVRAMSPGTNDPLTTMNALDDLCAGLASIAVRPDPPEGLTDESGTARVRLRVVSVRHLVEFVSDVLRVAVVAQPVVAGRLVETLARVARRAVEPSTVVLVIEEMGAVAIQLEASGAIARDVRRMQDLVEELQSELQADLRSGLRSEVQADLRSGLRRDAP